MANKQNSKWTALAIPTPTVSGNKRTYAISNDKPALVQTVANGYGVIDSRVVRASCRYIVYANDGYVWSYMVEINTSSIVITTFTNSTDPATYYIKLNAVIVFG